MTRAATIASSATRLPWWQRLVLSEYLVFWLSAGCACCLAPLVPGLFSGSNLHSLLLALLPLLVVAMGQTLVLITGGIDLSVTSTIALSSVTGAFVLHHRAGAWVPAGLAAMLAVGLTVGLVNGLAVTRLRMPAFIVTLTTMMFFGGLAVWLTQSRSIGELPASFNVLGAKWWLALPLTLALGLLLQLLLDRTVWGRWFFAVGHNARAALISGVPVAGATVAAYCLAGLCAACAAILYTGQAESGSPVMGQRILLDVIAATVIGGTSLFGGRGKILWTVFGVVFIKLIDNSLDLLSLPLATVTIVKGSVIILATLLDALRHRWLRNV
jgi:ribose transport system permease protein